MLSIVVDRLDQISIKCIESTKKSCHAFDEVIADIDELILASVNTKTVNERDIEQNKYLYSECEKKKKAREEEIKRDEDAYQKTKEMAEEALKNYREQINNSNDLGKLFVATLMDGICDAVKFIPTTAGIFVGNILSKLNEQITGQVQCNNVMRYGAENGLIQSMETILVNLDDVENIERDNVLDWIVSLKEYSKYPSITEEGKRLNAKAKEVKKFLESNITKLNNPNLKEEIKGLQVSIRTLLQIVYQSRQEQKRVTEEKESSKYSSREQVIRGDNEKTRSTQELYNSQSAKKEELRKRLIQQKEEAMDMAIQLERIDMTSIKLEDIIDQLRQGIVYMGRVRANWVHLTNFFDNIHTIVSINLSPRIQDFNKIAKDDFQKRILLQTSLKAIGYGMQISNCAQIYYEISKKYVMPVVGSISNELALTKEQAQSRQSEIRKQMEETHAGVEELIRQKWGKFKSNVNDQMDVYAKNLIKSIKLSADKKAIVN